MATWKDIPGLPGYKASTAGEIRCEATGHDTKGGDAGRYLKVEVARGGGRELEYVHILVCTAYHGKPKEGQVVLHKDDDTKNNRPSNLKWGTQSENVQQAYDRGRVPGKKSSTESYMEYRDALESLELALTEYERLETAIESMQVTMGYLQDHGNDPVVLSMALKDLTRAQHLTRVQNVPTASVEALELVPALEQMAKLTEAAKRMAKQVAKTIVEAWNKLVAWFKEYIGKVGERTRQLRGTVRDSKTVGMTKVAANNALESLRTTRGRVGDALTALRGGGNETTPETIAIASEVSKAVSPMAKQVDVSKDAFVTDAGGDMADKATMDRILVETEALNSDLGKLNSAADRVMRGAEKALTDPKSTGPAAMDKDGNAKDASLNQSKKGEYTKLAAAIQSINRTGSSITQKVLGGVTKAISMTIPNKGNDTEDK